MRVVDLTQPLSPGTTPWPGEQPLRIEEHANVPADGYYARRIDLHEHTGTHFDAPAHFVEGGATVDEIAAGRLVVPVRVVDVSGQASENPDYAVTVDDIYAMEREHGELQPGDALLALTGWDMHLGDPERYVGAMRFPGFSAEAADLVVDRGLAGIGIDTLSVDRGCDDTYPVHHRTLPAGLWQLEGLVGLDLIPVVGAMLVVGVPPVVGASGFPARVLALVP
ncbi:MAG: cyclase family protein [Thermoleophilia bacterium]|jgi:kynurenine formamidase